jgi:F-type H+-transporting ATPase subunit b
MENLTNVLTPIADFFKSTWDVLAVFLEPIFSAIGNLYVSFINTTLVRSNSLNFILFLIFFAWLFKKIDFSGIIAKKRQEIIDTIKKSEEDKLKAKENLEKTQDSLKNIDNDIQKIIDDGKNTANLVKQQAEEKVVKELNSIEEKTQKQFEANENKVKNEISKSVVTAAIAISKQHIISSLDETTQKELIYKFIDELDNLEVNQ